MKKITVVGCGVMGSALINALMNNDYDVTIIDLDKTQAEPFIKRGAKYFDSLDKAENLDIVLLNLPTHTIAASVINNMPKEKLKGMILVDTTTSTPAEVKDMADIASKYGMIHLDAAIEVYPGDIGTSSGYIVYAGDENAFKNLQPALESFGKAVYLGENIVGASVTDLAVLQVHFAAIAGLAEAAAFCIKNDYSVPKFIDQTRAILPIMLEGNLRSFGSELANYDREFDDASECTLNIEATAAETILRAMKSDGVKTPCGDAVLKLFKDGIESGYSAKNVCSVVNELI